MPRRGHHIEVIARAIILERGLLLACRNLKKGYYYLPGGHVEPGEPAAEALARELKEEAGLKVKVGPLVLTSENSFKAHHEINLVFHVERRAKGRVRSLEKSIGFEWLPLDGKHDLRPASIRTWLRRRRSTWNSDMG